MSKDDSGEFYSVKHMLCVIFTEVKYVDRLTYDQLKDKTGLSKSQIGNILNNKGKDVGTVKIHLAIDALGYNVGTYCERKEPWECV